VYNLAQEQEPHHSRANEQFYAQSPTLTLGKQMLQP
jgi:hypothetical protein